MFAAAMRNIFLQTRSNSAMTESDGSQKRVESAGSFRKVSRKAEAGAK
jgi:hypothetical protein